MIVERDEADLVAAHVGIAVGFALIGDVAHHVPVLVLRPRLAEVRADPPVEQRQVVVVVPFERQRAQPDETAAVDQLALDAGELARERVERKLLAADVAQILGDGFRGDERGVELAHVGGVELDGPRGGIGDVARAPVDVRLQRLRLERDHACTIACGPRTRLPGSAPVGSPSRYTISPDTIVAS